MAGKRVVYAPEFKAEAVRLYRSSDKSLKEISADLGIHSDSLRAWLKQTDLDAGIRTDGLTSDERTELNKLRRENRVLKVEKEILKSRSLLCFSVRLWADAESPVACGGCRRQPRWRSRWRSSAG